MVTELSSDKVEIQPAIDLMDFGRHMEVATLEAIVEMMVVASLLQAPYVSTTIGMHTYPSSEHLGSLDWYFLD